MKQILLSMLMALLALTAVAQSKTLEQYRAESGRMCMNPQFMYDYINALKQAKIKGDEMKKISDGFALINIFYFINERMASNLDETEDSTIKYYSPDEIEKMSLPLSSQRKVQIHFAKSLEKSNVAMMQKYLFELLKYPMPTGNLCDPVIYGGMLNATMEKLDLEQARQYKAKLEEYLKKPADNQVENLVKSHLEDLSGYIMLKEMDANKN